MARKTLYPRLPDETALDKFLNQTLPRIQERRAAAERRQQDISRADRIRQENLDIDRQRYEKEQADKQIRFDIQREETAFGYHAKGLEAISEGNDNLGLSYLQRSNLLYTKGGRMNPYGSPDNVYQGAIERRGVLDSFNSYAQALYTAQPGQAQVDAWNNLSEYYNENSNNLNYNSTMGRVMSQLNNQYKRFGAITSYLEEPDFTSYEKDGSAFSKYEYRVKYNPNTDLTAEFTQANETIEVTPDRLQNYYFTQNKDYHESLARTYLRESLAAFGFEDIQWNQETWNSLGAASRRHLEVKFRDTMANALFGHEMKLSGRYMRLSDEDKKKVDDELKNTYNFPRPNEIPREVKQENTSTDLNNNSGNQTGNENLQDNMSGQFGAYKRRTPNLKLDSSTEQRTNIKKNNNVKTKKSLNELGRGGQSPEIDFSPVRGFFSNINKSLIQSQINQKRKLLNSKFTTEFDKKRYKREIAELRARLGDE